MKKLPMKTRDEIALTEFAENACLGADDGRISPHAVNSPMILGHQVKGTIEKVGVNLPYLKPISRTIGPTTDSAHFHLFPPRSGRTVRTEASFAGVAHGVA